jgi:hypothetical protein
VYHVHADSDTKASRIVLILPVGHLAPCLYYGFATAASQGMLGLARNKFSGAQAGAEDGVAVSFAQPSLVNRLFL